MRMKFDSPFWSIGFRPFFLLGSIAGFILILWWALQFQSGAFLQSYYPPTIWHGHEMIFGYSLAILSGFLLTASQNWSGIRGVHGSSLFLLVLIWVAGRITSILPAHFSVLIAFVDLIYLPCFGYMLFPYLSVKGQERNRKLLVILFLLFFANVLIHGELLFGQKGFAAKGLYLAVDLFVLIMLLIGGRVLPFFKSRVFQNVVTTNSKIIEKISIALLITFLISGFFKFSEIRSLAASLLFIVFAYKWLRLKPFETIKVPILFTLFVSYAWILVGFLLIGLQSFFNFPESWPLHCFTVGGIGGLTIGMMTRISLGHTGRAIRASSVVVLSYVFINLAFIFRVLLPFVGSFSYLSLILISGVFWSLCFLIYIITFTSILLKPRPDST